MAKFTLTLTPQANQDLEIIFVYTLSNWNIEQAEKYQDELYVGMTHLLNNPLLGKAYLHNNLDYRFLQIAEHLVFYRIENNFCRVIRILHKSMDVEEHL